MPGNAVRRPSLPRRMAGLSMVELMIAIALGLAAWLVPFPSLADFRFSFDSKTGALAIGDVGEGLALAGSALRLDPERVAQPRGERHGPRRVHAAAERRQDADAPVADLVAEALDDNGLVGGDSARRAFLLAQEG